MNENNSPDQYSRFAVSQTVRFNSPKNSIPIKAVGFRRNNTSGQPLSWWIHSKRYFLEQRAFLRGLAKSIEVSSLASCGVGILARWAWETCSKKFLQAAYKPCKSWWQPSWRPGGWTATSNVKVFETVHLVWRGFSGWFAALGYREFVGWLTDLRYKRSCGYQEIIFKIFRSMEREVSGFSLLQDAELFQRCVAIPHPPHQFHWGRFSQC